MADASATIDVNNPDDDPGYLLDFARDMQGRVDLAHIAAYTDVTGFSRDVEMPEAQHFGEALATSTTAIQKFCTQVQYGCNWLAVGAQLMAGSFSSTNHRLGLVMAQVPSSTGLPEIAPELTGKPDEKADAEAPRLPLDLPR
jgi:hypothetical protein